MREEKIDCLYLGFFGKGEGRDGCVKLAIHFMTATRHPTNSSVRLMGRKLGSSATKQKKSNSLVWS